MATKLSLDAIRAVRAKVERSMPECRAALEASKGDVNAAIASLQTDLERKRDRSAAIFAHLGNTTTGAEGRPARPAPANEQGCERVFSDLERVIAERSLWTGAPNPSGLIGLRAAYERRFARPLPVAIDAFLARWNGFEADASTVIWGTERNDRNALDAYDESECEEAFVIGELRDSGYLFLRGNEVWFYDYSDPPPVFRVAPNFESFLRDMLTFELDALAVVERAREAAARE
jgi:hypothetical protein